MALAVPSRSAGRFTSRVGGGSAFFVKFYYITVIFTIHRLDAYDAADADDAPHTQIGLADGAYSASQDSHVSREYWIEFGQALQSFPQTPKHEALFESGSRDAGYYCYIRLRAYERDMAGHAAFEVEMTNHSTGASHRSSHFHVFCEAAALNRLGHSLERWARSDSPKFEFTDQNHDWP